MLLLSFNAVLAAWVGWDATRRRSGNRILWTAGALAMSLLLVPAYLANRPLLSGETRRGGPWWHALSRFAALLSAFILLQMAKHGYTVAAEADIPGTLYPVGYAIGAALASNLWLGWLLFAPPAFAAGMIFRNPDRVEEGPTDASAPQA